MRFWTSTDAIAAPAVVLDVPLLFETGGDAVCDHIIVVHASAATTAKRALARAGMTPAKLAAILASQMPVDAKKKRADLCLDSDLQPEATRQGLNQMACRDSCAYDRQ
jgi:dephospho-CoA kinase